MKSVLSNTDKLSYMGRIEFVGDTPTMTYSGSSVTFKFVGKYVEVDITNERIYCDSYFGVIVNGEQTSIKLEDGKNMYIIVDKEDVEEYTVTIFKRKALCHYMTINDIRIDGELLEYKNNNVRKMEFFGDSVTAGEVSEVIGYEGKSDPEHNGQYCNSYYSYSWITARKLNADFHNTSQGGIALLDNTGYFVNGEVGMVSMYDKLKGNKQLGEVVEWDFEKFTPQVVVVAIGQNDNHPKDIMVYINSDEAKFWRSEYEKLILNIRDKYKDALIILKTTILMHNKNYDESIKMVCDKINKERGDEKVVFFMYSDEIQRTPGHIRKSEAELMADELVDFIEGFGEDIWN